MTAFLRVDPDCLCAAAAAQCEVAAAVSGIAAGQSMTDASTGLVGLASGAACQVAGGLLDAVTTIVTTDLTAHSERLTLAATSYRDTDSVEAQRLRVTR